MKFDAVNRKNDVFKKFVKYIEKNHIDLHEKQCQNIIQLNFNLK